MSDFADWFLDTAQLMARVHAADVMTDVQMRRAFKAADAEARSNRGASELEIGRAARAKETEHGNTETPHS